MAAVTAESVVIEVVARLDKAKGDVKALETQFDTSTSKMDRAARTLEGHLDNLGKSSTDSFKQVGTAATKAANDVDRASARIANAKRNIGRQIADVGAQAASGQSPFLIFAQQAPQIADALADTGGKAARVAAFFAGPWGAALLAAGSVLATLIPGLLRASDAANDMSKAQAELANFVDLTTGAINRQTTAIQRLAAAQARQGAIENQTRTYTDARSGAIQTVANAGVAPGDERDFRVGLVAADTDPVSRRRGPGSRWCRNAAGRSLPGTGRRSSSTAPT